MHYIPSQIVYIFTFVNKIIIGIFIASVSAIFINFFLLSSILYSLYKSYILIHIIFLLNGYSILNYNYFTLKQRKKYWLLLFLIEFILDLFFEYIIYFIPSINNYYLFLIKSFFEHCTILVVTIISFCNNFNRLFKQYKFDRRLRTILTIGYRIKVIIYGKVILFSFLYSIAFILLYLIEMIYSIYLTTFSFYYNYAFNIGLEMFFGILLSIFFSSFKISFLFYYPIYYDYDSLRFSAKIKECKEKEFKISNLKKNMIKNEYQKKEYPLILINPFTKTDNVFKDFHIGMVEKKNKKY